MTQNINDELERLLEADPIASHAKIMELMRPQPIIHKDFHGRQPAIGDDTNGNEPGPLLYDQIDLMIDAMAQALAQTSNELRAEFESMIENTTGSLVEQVALLQSQTATLQGQVGVLMSMISGIVSNNNSSSVNTSRSIEAETKTTRRVRVRRSESTT